MNAYYNTYTALIPLQQSRFSKIMIISEKVKDDGSGHSIRHVDLVFVTWCYNTPVAGSQIKKDYEKLSYNLRPTPIHL